MSRPEMLFPLFAGVETLAGIGPRLAQVLDKARLGRVRDLAFHLPSGWVDRRARPTVQGLQLPADATVEVEVLRHHAGRGAAPHRIEVRDAETVFEIVYFRARQETLTKLLPRGERRLVSGKVDLFDGHARMVHPDHVLKPGETLPDDEPVYPLPGGLTQKTLIRATEDLLGRLPDLAEWIDPGVLADRGWPGWRAALRRAHRPNGGLDGAARARLAYDEVLSHQAALAIGRADRRRRPGRATAGDGARRDAVLAALPYAPTGAQTRAIAEIAADMASPHRMNRLLQGDVGAGKTLVALMALAIAVEAGGQGALMAPTEILARQHLESLAPLAASAGLRLDVLTGRDQGAARAAKLAALAEGRTDVLIGTHALFQKDVAFRDLRLAVIDEQHRFGVRERLGLTQKGVADVLVMTATPIPRSLELASFGDMDVSRLDEKPPGRQPIDTALVSADRMEAVVARLAAALDAGRQAYWVCPLVEESETVEMAAAEDRAVALRAALGDRVGLVHGRLAPADKDAAMADFAAGRTRVLVATTVIEVGVNVPAATIMVIEEAQKFGLAQLHQLRGRVGRGSARSQCLLMYSPPLSEAATTRLTTMRDTEDGFRIAETDLKLRGAGDVLGTAQSGLPRFAIADLEREPDLLALARDDARALLARDPELSSPRGQALRVLLWLMERDESIRLLRAG